MMEDKSEAHHKRFPPIVHAQDDPASEFALPMPRPLVPTIPNIFFPHEVSFDTAGNANFEQEQLGEEFSPPSASETLQSTPTCRQDPPQHLRQVDMGLYHMFILSPILTMPDEAASIVSSMPSECPDVQLPVPSIPDAVHAQ
ncbi:hypothetical protein Hypma_008125 [Hypsizygus marmoreus]|uniref:Uncharacterized protein n=1 Tax=Hypsizygus marmoreus TaxID=39966 RepID=A0A369JZE8_HYPMA|nr:hypothetical protein Hypma_008125 [Hypsizygus marmoreus]